MEKKARKKDKTYICVVCNKTIKASRSKKCCGRSMLTKDKAWVD